MKVGEACELLDCGFCLWWGFVVALFTDDRSLFDATEVRIKRIHAQIDTRKAARDGV